MARMFIIDGYNAINAIPELEAECRRSLESARKGLALYLASWIKRFANANLLIVFDGKDGISKDFVDNRICGVRCVFTKSNEDADDRIISMVRDSPHPGCIVVISADNKVRNNSRSLGAVIKGSEFLQDIKDKNNKTYQTHQTKNISSKKETSVTDYYREYLERNEKI